MPTPEDDIRALGNFFYEFSGLIAQLRFWLAAMTVRDMEWTDPNRGRIVESLMLHTGDMNAEHLINVYFAVAEVWFDYNADEARIATWLRTQLIELAFTRNDFAHGEWKINAGAMTLVEQSGVIRQEVHLLPTTMSRTKARNKGEKRRVAEYRAADIDAITFRLIEFRRWVVEWVRIICGQVVADIPVEGESVSPHSPPTKVRPGDVYVRLGDQVLREGPLANRVALLHY